MAKLVDLTPEEELKRKRPKIDNLSALLSKDIQEGGLYKQEKIKINLDKHNTDPVKFPKPASINELKENFKKFCENSLLGENFNTGMYLRATELKEILRDAESAGSDYIHVSFGLRKAQVRTDNTIDWNCFHLILQSAKPTQDVGKAPTNVSSQIFSSYDGDETNYTGPKPGCPPFTSPE